MFFALIWNSPIWKKVASPGLDKTYISLHHCKALLWRLVCAAFSFWESVLCFVTLTGFFTFFDSRSTLFLSHSHFFASAADFLALALASDCYFLRARSASLWALEILNIFYLNAISINCLVSASNTCVDMVTCKVLSSVVIFT